MSIVGSEQKDNNSLHLNMQSVRFLLRGDDSVTEAVGIMAMTRGTIGIRSTQLYISQETFSLVLNKSYGLCFYCNAKVLFQGAR
jgi:hypothetical protein